MVNASSARRCLFYIIRFIFCTYSPTVQQIEISFNYFHASFLYLIINTTFVLLKQRDISLNVCFVCVYKPLTRDEQAVSFFIAVSQPDK